MSLKKYKQGNNNVEGFALNMLYKVFFVCGNLFFIIFRIKDFPGYIIVMLI